MFISVQSANEIRDYLFASSRYNGPASNSLDFYTSSLEGGYQVHFSRVTVPGSFPLVIAVNVQETATGKRIDGTNFHLNIQDQEIILAEAMWGAVQRAIGKLYLNYITDTLGLKFTASHILADIDILTRAKLINEGEVVITNKGYDITMEQDGEVIYRDSLVRRNPTAFLHIDGEGFEEYVYTGHIDLSPITGKLVSAIREAIIVRLFTHPAIATEQFPVK